MIKKLNTIRAIDTSNLVKKTEHDVKIKDTGDKIPDHSVYVTTNNFNKFSGTIFDGRLKQAKLATKKDLGTVEQRAIENKKE